MSCRLCHFRRTCTVHFQFRRWFIFLIFYMQHFQVGRDHYQCHRPIFSIQIPHYCITDTTITQCCHHHLYHMNGIYLYQKLIRSVVLLIILLIINLTGGVSLTSTPGAWSTQLACWLTNCSLFLLLLSVLGYCSVFYCIIVVLKTIFMA